MAGGLQPTWDICVRLQTCNLTQNTVGYGGIEEGKTARGLLLSTIIVKQHENTGGLCTEVIWDG